MPEKSRLVPEEETMGCVNSNCLSLKLNCATYTNEKPFICGVVEGFYGRPWTPNQRKELFERMSRMGLHTYLYAPKDDCKHRVFWRELYSVEEAEHLSQLINAATAAGVDFVYALSPGLDICFSSKQEMTYLTRKVDQVREFGCHSFALLFDDIDSIMSQEDRDAFNSFADAQVSVTNQLLDHLCSTGKDPISFLFCPTEYCSTRAIPSVKISQYLNTVGAKLSPPIDILWTGGMVISRNITIDEIREVASVLRRPPLIWDNLHANDYDPKRLFLGPYIGRPNELLKYVRGVLTNPNCEFEGNFVALHTLGQWSKHLDKSENQNNEQSSTVEQYSPDVALRKALDDWISEFYVEKSFSVPGLGGMNAKASFFGGPPIIHSVNTCASATLPTTSVEGETLDVPVEEGIGGEVIADPADGGVGIAANQALNSLDPEFPSTVLTKELEPMACDTFPASKVPSSAQLDTLCPRSPAVVSMSDDNLSDHSPKTDNKASFVLGSAEETSPKPPSDAEMQIDSDSPQSTNLAVSCTHEAEMDSQEVLERIVKEVHTSTSAENIAASDTTNKTPAIRMEPQVRHIEFVPATENTEITVDAEMKLTPQSDPLTLSNLCPGVLGDSILQSTSSSIEILSEFADRENFSEESRKVLLSDILTRDDLVLLVELFYLPFEHGARGVKLLTDFHWLISNVEYIKSSTNQEKPDAATATVVDSKKEEWKARAKNFQELIDAVRDLCDKIMKIPNRAIVYDLYPYIWDIRGVLHVHSAFISWLDFGLSIVPTLQTGVMLNSAPLLDADYRPTWGNPNYKEAFLSGEQEPWMFRGGLSGELQRLLPMDGASDLFYHPPPFPPLPKMYTIRPYLPTDKEAVYRICSSINHSRLSLDQISDQQLIGDSIIGAYLTEENSRFCFVAEENDSICGYGLTIVDSAKYINEKQVDWLRTLCDRYPLSATDTASRESYIRTIRQKQTEPLPNYSNLLKEYQSKVRIELQSETVFDTAVPKRIFSCILSVLKLIDSTGVHCELDADDRESREFYGRLGFVHMPCPNDTSTDGGGYIRNTVIYARPNNYV